MSKIQLLVAEIHKLPSTDVFFNQLRKLVHKPINVYTSDNPEWISNMLHYETPYGCYPCDGWHTDIYGPKEHTNESRELSYQWHGDYMHNDVLTDKYNTISKLIITRIEVLRNTIAYLSVIASDSAVAEKQLKQTELQELEQLHSELSSIPLRELHDFEHNYLKVHQQLRRENDRILRQLDYLKEYLS